MKLLSASTENYARLVLHLKRLINHFSSIGAPLATILFFLKAKFIFYPGTDDASHFASMAANLKVIRTEFKIPFFRQYR